LITSPAARIEDQRAFRISRCGWIGLGGGDALAQLAAEAEGSGGTGAPGQAIRCSCSPGPRAMGSPVAGWWIPGL